MNYTNKTLEVQKVIAHLPNNLCAPFFGYMLNGGHQIEVTGCHVVFKKGGKVAKFEFNGHVKDSYKMDKNCVEKFEQFSRWFIRNGKQPLDILAKEAMAALARMDVNFGVIRSVAA